MNDRIVEHQAFSDWQGARRRVAAATGQLTRARNAADEERIGRAVRALRRASDAEQIARTRWERSSRTAAPADPLRGPMARLEATLNRLEEAWSRIEPTLSGQTPHRSCGRTDGRADQPGEGVQ